jgi:urease accessory protein
MSISLSFLNNRLTLNRVALPSRFFHFTDEENYLKLLCVGEGIFPEDKIRTTLKFETSSVVVATESATKVYPSTDGCFGINSISLHLDSSHVEYLNDEMILFQGAKLIQSLHINASEDSTFFYSDILTPGRSFESYDFERLKVKNRFVIKGKLEYIEAYDLSADRMKDYLVRHGMNASIFAKIYVKSPDMDRFETLCQEANLGAFGYTKTRKMLLGVLWGETMVEVKQKVMQAWALYRHCQGRASFHLGKW